MTQHAYGFKPSLGDIRDLYADPSGITLKPEYDPRKPGGPLHDVEPFDQGQEGSCTANAVNRALRVHDIVQHGEDRGDYARLATYWFERFLEHSPADQDTGAYGRDGFKAARRFGVPFEKDYPYTDDTSSSEFAQDPRTVLPASSFVKLDTTYKAVRRSLHAFQAVLSNAQTIAFGFTVYDSFESSEVARTGIVPMPSQGEQVLGGHEVLAVGYLKAKPEYALCLNSWGTGWGMEGFFLMPWAYLMDHDLASDFRTIYRPLP